MDYSILQLLIHVVVIIIFSDQNEELCQLITIIKVIIQLFHFIDSCFEYVHNKRENGHSGQKNDAHEDPLVVAPWVQVSKSHSWEACECKVGHYQDPTKWVQLVQLEMLDKVLPKCVESINLIYIVICYVTVNVEYNSNEISYKQDHHD